MQSKTSISLFISIILLSFFLMNSSKSKSSNQETIQELIEESINKKLQKYIDTRNKKCIKNIMKVAGQRADSIIIARAKSMKVIQDTMQRPNAPIRPDRPDLLAPIDSSFPIPLLDKDSLIFEDTIN